jgi:O-antigen ligase
MMGFALAAMALAAMSVFEAGRHWLLYSSLDEAWGLSWGYGGYLERGEGGVLRAQGTTGQPIALGYVMAVSLGFFLFLQKSVPGAFWKTAGFGLILAGLIASVSRGPWVGALAMLLAFVLTGPRAGSRLMQAASAALVFSPVLFVTSLGEKIVDYLPFVGTVEEENITYRQRLIEIAIDVVLQNPLFGAFDYIYSPAFQELKQGQGIIDVVNSYLGIGLSSGLVGLGLFTGFFVSGIVGVIRTMRTQADKAGEVHLLGRALLTTLVCIVVTIFTVSSITVVAPIYWCVVGLAAGYTVFAPQAARRVVRRPSLPVARPA